LKSKNHIPPRLAQRFLNWFLRDDLAEEVQGDLEEKFIAKLEKATLFQARLNYWYQVVNYLRPFAIGAPIPSQLIHYAMFRNYFKIGWRNILSKKGYSFINISGLAIGMAVAILIGLWVWDELSYNKYHDNYAQIAQVMRQEGDYTNNILTTGMGTLLKTEYGNHFDKVAIVRGRLEERAIVFKDNSFLQNGYFMQPEGPEMFSFKMISGTQKGLEDMFSILLSESLAHKLFDNEDPMDQIVRMDDRWDLKVTGVYEDLPKNSVFSEASYLAPLDLYLDGWSSLDVWDNYNMYVYAQINPGSDFGVISTSIKNALQPHLSDGQPNTGIFLHPMSKWHLYAEFEDGKPVTSQNLLFLLFMGTIGILVLILASINFMNLSTARSEKRAKEVGIRKAIGSVRGQLVSQFLVESFLIASCSFVMAIILVNIILPWFNDVSGKELQILWANPIFWLACLGFVLFTSLLAGSYPAFYLSSFKPLKVLKGSVRAGSGTGVPRKVLVVVQFTVSISLIIGTVIVYQQIQFAKNRPVGYSRESLLTLPVRARDFSQKYEAFRNSLKESGYVNEVALSNYPITSSKGWNTGFEWPGKDPNQNVSFNTIRVTPEYGNTIGLEFVAGRDFSRDRASDRNGIIINESALDIMGIEDPVGKVIDCPPIGSAERSQLTIVGVVKDMIKGSPYEPAFPSIIFYSDSYLSDMLIKLNRRISAGAALPEVERIFHEYFPFVPFDYKFVDDVYNQKFASEARIGYLAGFFTILAILISCMGLFGLASFIAEQRTKEIGIRKVLGATTVNLWQMLTKEFLMLVMIACVVAIPISYIMLRDWLQNYEYHTEIAVWVLVFAGAGTLMITLLTVSYQSIKAALMDPVDSLRME
jgi:ABC-type antimicrobial peptide transport system permease subunit